MFRKAGPSTKVSVPWKKRKIHFVIQSHRKRKPLNHSSKEALLQCTFKVFSNKQSLFWYFNFCLELPYFLWINNRWKENPYSFQRSNLCGRKITMPCPQVILTNSGQRQWETSHGKKHQLFLSKGETGGEEGCEVTWWKSLYNETYHGPDVRELAFWLRACECIGG